MKKYVNYVNQTRHHTWHFVAAAIKCWLWIIVHLPQILFKRISTQRLRVYSDAEIFNVMGQYVTYFPHFSHSGNAYSKIAAVQLA